MEKVRTTRPAMPGVMPKSAARRGSKPSQMRSAAPLRKPARDSSVMAARMTAGDAGAEATGSAEGTWNRTSPHALFDLLLRGGKRGGARIVPSQATFILPRTMNLPRVLLTADDHS